MSEEATRGQKGSVSIFVAAVIFPLLFILLSIVIDLNAYKVNTQRLQQATDDAALYGVKFLPYREKAEAAARSYLSHYARTADTAEISAGSDALFVSIKEVTPLSFATFFGIESGFLSQAVTRARGVPFDVSIMVDRSSYMAPPLTALGGEAWSDEGEWNTADLIEDGVLALSSPTVDARIATQQCFNPVFSALKYAAILALDNLSGFGLNRSSVGFFPGGIDAISSIRPMQKGGKRSGEMESPFPDMRWTVDGDGESIWVPDYQATPETFIGETGCAAIAETDHNSRYRFPDLNSEFSVAESCSGSLIDTSSWAVRDDYLPCLRSREVMWSRSVHSSELPSTSAVFARILNTVASNRADSGRGGLVNNAIRAGIVLTADLPREGGIVFDENGGVDPVRDALRSVFSVYRERLSMAVEQPIDISYVLVDRPDRSFSESEIQSLQTFFNEESIIEGQDPEKFRIRVFHGSRPEVIVQNVIASLVLQRKTAVLSRGL